MGQKKSVKKEYSEEELTSAMEAFKNIKSHYMSFLISTQEITEKDWKAEGTMKIGSSLDGEHWGELEMGVTGYDVNSDSALATVMVSLNNFINSPEFVVEMTNRMKKSLDEEAKLPESLAS
jgi:hypothetical protein